HPNAHRDRDRLTGLPSLVVLRLDSRTEPPPHRKSARLDDFAQLLEMREALVLALAGEDERKFLAAVAIRGAAAGGLRQPRGDEAQHVVARVVPVGVVEALEVIDIDHRDG